MMMKRKRISGSKLATAMKRTRGVVFSSKVRRPSTVTKIIRELQSNHELKYFDTRGSAVAMSNSGTVACFNEIAEGTDYLNRIGRKVRCAGIHYDITIGGTVTAPTNVITAWSWSLVLDRQPNAATAAYSTFYDVLLGAATAPAAFKDNATQNERVDILKHEEGYTATTVSGGVVVAGVAQASENIHLRGFYPFKEIIQYSSSAATFPQTNALYLAWAADTATASHTITYQLRFAYMDV